MKESVVSLIDYLKTHYQLPLTEGETLRLGKFLETIQSRDDKSTVHTSVLGDIESYKAEFTLMNEVRITRLTEYIYQEDLVFSLYPITPGVVSSTVTRLHDNPPLSDKFEFPTVIMDSIRSVDRYYKRSPAIGVVSKEMSTKISYDILILNTALDVMADGIFFEDIPEEEQDGQQ
mgnify:CR=1 FL=1